MSAYRRQARDAIAAAVAARPALADWRRLSAWAQAISVEDLPVFAVVTPVERVRQDTQTGERRDVQVQVIAKMQGNDSIEDAMDAVAAEIEAAIKQADLPGDWYWQVGDITTVVDGTGESRVGSITVNCTVTLFA